MTERTDPNDRPSDPGAGPAATAPDVGGAAPVRLAGRGRTRRPGELLRRKGLRLWLVLILAMTSVAVVGVLTPLSARSSTAGATTPCAPDGSGGCLVTLPCPVGQTANCPTIDVTPNTNVTRPVVYVDGEELEPDHQHPRGVLRHEHVAHRSSCLSGNWDSQLLTPTAVPVTSDPTNGNLTSMSYPVFFDPAGQGNDQIPAHDLINKTGTAPASTATTRPTRANWS